MGKGTCRRQAQGQSPVAGSRRLGKSLGACHTLPICIRGRPLHLGSQKLRLRNELGQWEALVGGKMLGCPHVQSNDVRRGHLA